MNIQCDMGEPVVGIGYQFYGIAGRLGTRVTTGIASVVPGIYIANATPPNGARGVIWDDATGLKTASDEIAPFHEFGDSTPFETTRRLIYERFDSMWVPADFFPVTIEGKTIPEEPSGWGRLSIVQGQTIQISAGRAHTRSAGICYLSVFCEAMTGGTRIFTTAADRFAQIFNNAQMASGNVTVLMRAARMEDAGHRGSYRQKNLACNFQTDCYGE